MPPTLTLHAVPPSHPCMTVAAALELKGLEYERVDFPHAERLERMEEIYGEGNSTVPGLLIDEQPVHGSRAILARLEQIEPEPTLYPSEEVREAERWGDEQLQDLGRCLPWGAMYFRPESMGTFAGPALSRSTLPAPTSRSSSSARRGATTGSQRHGCTTTSPACRRSSRISSSSPRTASSTASGRTPPTCRSPRRSACCCRSATSRPLLDGSAAERIALRFFPSYPGSVPQGAYPAGWVPSS